MIRSERPANAPPLRWSVIGVGIAGRARGRAIVADPRADLVAVHRGRFAGELPAPDLEFDEAISRADAVAVCSPTSVHATQVAAALRSGRHVTVEFPLAWTADAASEMFALAKEAGRVLHVEHIELLSGATQVLREAFTTITAGTLVHRVARAQPVSPEQLAPLLVPRLHRLLAVAGPIAGVADVEGGAGWLSARVRLAKGDVSVRIEATPSATRSTHMHLETDTGVWEMRDRQVLRDGQPQKQSRGNGLFLEDQLVATARILDGSQHYVSDAQILEVLALAERIAREA